MKRIARIGSDRPHCQFESGPALSGTVRELIANSTRAATKVATSRITIANTVPTRIDQGPSGSGRIAGFNLRIDRFHSCRAVGKLLRMIRSRLPKTPEH